MKKLLFLLSVLLILNINISAFANNSVSEVIKTSTIYQQYLKGGMEAAEKQYTLLKDNKTIDIKDYMIMLQIYLSKNKTREVIITANEGLKQYPDSELIYTVLGMAYANINKYDSAIDAYTESIKIKPTEPALYNRAQIYCYTKNDIDNAIKDYTEALKYVEQYADKNTKNLTISEIYEERALCYSKKSELDKAISDYTNAIKFNSQKPSLYYNRGVIKINKANRTTLKNEASKILASAYQDLDTAADLYKKKNNINMYNKILEYKKMQSTMSAVK